MSGLTDQNFKHMMDTGIKTSKSTGAKPAPHHARFFYAPISGVFPPCPDRKVKSANTPRLCVGGLKPRRPLVFKTYRASGFSTPSQEAFMTTFLSITDINTTVNHEPRISHMRLAEALGYSSHTKMRELITRHMEALKRFGGVSPTVGDRPETGGRPPTTYWLNKKQCLYICTKSETKNATEVTIQMVEVFEAVTSGKIVQVKGHRRVIKARPVQLALPAPKPDTPTIGDVLERLDHAGEWKAADILPNARLAAAALRDCMEVVEGHAKLQRAFALGFVEESAKLPQTPVTLPKEERGSA